MIIVNVSYAAILSALVFCGQGLFYFLIILYTDYCAYTTNAHRFFLFEIFTDFVNSGMDKLTVLIYNIRSEHKQVIQGGYIMARNNDVGLKQLENGNWSCRIYKKINGVQIDTSCRVDERTGAPFTTKAQARNYREYKIAQLRNPELQEKKETAVKFSRVWKDFLDSDSAGKARSTVVKYTSVWENHLKKEFGEKYISGPEAVSVQEINNYLTKMYMGTDLAYGYIQGFLRLFYLLYGLAYRHNYISMETLNKYTKEKNVRISMPKKTVKDLEDEGAVDIYDSGQIADMEKIFKGTDLEPAFMFGIYCGLRESEIFGLSWDDFDKKNKTISVNKQLVMIDGCWCITRLKTLQASRVIDLPDDFANFLRQRRRAVGYARTKQSYKNRANEIVLDMRDKKPVEVVGFNFLNRKLNDGLEGKLLTINSFKFYAKKIKQECGFDFKTHKLRKTHLSYLASHGYPLKSLMERAGHKKIETTMKYYIAQDETMRQQSLRIINTISLDDPVVAESSVESYNGKILHYTVRASGRVETVVEFDPKTGKQ